MDKKYVEILQQLLASEQLRLSFKGYEDADVFYTGDVEYSIGDLDLIYFELEKISS